MKPGNRVIRGPDWHLGNLDGGPGNIGTVVKIYPNNCVLVKWDTIGTETVCKAGLNGTLGLSLYDDAQKGHLNSLTSQNQRITANLRQRKLQRRQWKSLEHLLFSPKDERPYRYSCRDCGHKIDKNSCICGATSFTDLNIPSELKADPRLLSLYVSALKSGQNQDCSLRVNVVGNYKQGKTTLVRRLVSEDVEDVESTNGINVDRHIFKTNKESTLNWWATNPSVENESPLAVHIWDFGGQYIFYATHTLFHSSRAVYILVFDLSTELTDCSKDEEYPADTRADRNMEYFARFWLNSIHSFVGSADGKEPPVLLVGTHMDKLNGSAEDKMKEADRYFENVRALFDDTQMGYHILPKDFAVDNTDPSDKATEELRKEIVRLGRSRAKLYSIPVKWVALSDGLKKLQYLKIVSFEEIVETDAKNDFPLKDKTQIKLFLQYHHAKGNLIYFDEDILSDFVVLDVQYLIDAFKCIITSERFCRKDIDIRPFWGKLISEGKLETNLIDAVWSRDVEHNFMTHKNILLEYLKRHHIISEVLQYDERTGESKGMGWFIVPSLLACPVNRDELRYFLDGKHQTSVRLVLVFDSSSIVHTIFHRLLAAAIGRWPVAHIERKSLLYENLGVVLLREDYAGIIETNGVTIDFRVVNLCLSPAIENAVADQFRRFAGSFVEHEFRKLRDYDANNEKGKKSQNLRLGAVGERLNMPHISSYRCNNESHGLEGSVKIESLEKWESRNKMPCPDHLSHDICVSDARSEWFQEDGVTGKVPDKKLNEQHLSKIALAIGGTWEFLALNLGLTSVEVDHIASDSRTKVMKIFEMLCKWQSDNEEHATLNELVKVLKSCEEVKIDWDKMRNLIDELK